MEAQSYEAIPFPDEDLNTWKFFVYWLFHDNLPKMENLVVDLDEEWGILPMLAKVWIFADKVNLTQLQDCSMDLLCQVLVWFIQGYDRRTNDSDEDEYEVEGEYEDEDSEIEYSTKRWRGFIPQDIFVSLLPRIRDGSKLFDFIAEVVAYHVAHKFYAVESLEGYFANVSFAMKITQEVLDHFKSVDDDTELENVFYLARFSATADDRNLVDVPPLGPLLGW